MQKFVAARTFALGQTGVTVRKGQEILFDGTMADFGEGESSFPLLRGAIKTGWVTLAADYDEDDMTAEIPVSANIQVRHPTNGGNPMDQRTQARTRMATTESDEREVGSVSQHARTTRSSNTNHRRGQPVNQGRRTASETVELQDGTPVRELKTPSGQRAMTTTTTLTGGNVGAALAATRVTIDPGQGITREEMMERMEPEQAAEYAAQIESRRAQYVDEEAPKPVARVASKKGPQTREGITSKVTTGGGIETMDLSGLDNGQAEEGLTESEGITFKTTNGPKQGTQAHPRQAETAKAKPAAKPAVVVKEAGADVRRMVAKQLCKDFPDLYDFTLAPKKKLARIQADFEDRPDVIRAIFAAEGDEFKGMLLEEFPEVFSG